MKARSWSVVGIAIILGALLGFFEAILAFYIFGACPTPSPPAQFLIGWMLLLSLLVIVTFLLHSRVFRSARLTILFLVAAVLFFFLMDVTLSRASVCVTVWGTSISCITISGYTCSSMYLSVNGNLTFTLENTGTEQITPIFYNIGMACTTAHAQSRLPVPSTAMVYLSVSGSATNVHANSSSAGALNLQGGQTISVSGLKCFDSKGSAMTDLPVGAPFAGTLFMNYTLKPGAPSSSNPMQTIWLATVAAKVS